MDVRHRRRGADAGAWASGPARWRASSPTRRRRRRTRPCARLPMRSGRGARGCWRPMRRTWRMRGRKGLGGAMLDRLELTEARVAGMVEGLRAIAGQPDPVGQVIAAWDRPSGLHIRRVRDAARGHRRDLREPAERHRRCRARSASRPGNAAILRGGSESLRSSLAIHAGLVEGLAAAGLPEAAIQLRADRRPGRGRRDADGLDGAHRRASCRAAGRAWSGGCRREARVPVFAHLEGIVHVYVDRAADLTRRGG